MNLGAFFGFLLGIVAGAVLLALWWNRTMRQPAKAQAMLSAVHRAAHPHWLQESAAADARRVCPCCGWTAPAGETGPVPPTAIARNHATHTRGPRDERH